MVIHFFNRAFDISEIGNLSPDTILVPLNGCAMWTVTESNLQFEDVGNYFEYKYDSGKRGRLWELFQGLFKVADTYAAKFYKDSCFTDNGPFSLQFRLLSSAIEWHLTFAEVFEKICDRFNPEEIVFHGGHFSDNRYYYEFSGSEDEFYSGVLKHCSGNRGLKFTEIKRNKKEKPQPVSVSEKRGIKDKILAGIKKIAKATPAGKREVLRRRKLIDEQLDLESMPNKKALFLQEGWGISYYQQFFKDVEVSDILSELVPLREDAGDTERVLELDELIASAKDEIARFTDECGENVEWAVKKVFGNYINLIPTCIVNRRICEKFLDRTNPDYVFFTNLNGEKLAMQMAINSRENIVSVMKCHGDSFFDLLNWRNSELIPSDIYLLEYDEFRDYFRKQSRQIGSDTTCITDSVRMVSQERAPVPDEKKLVFVGNAFYRYNFVYGMTSYWDSFLFKLQHNILEVLSEIEDYKIVFKCRPFSDIDLHEPMAEYIAEKFPNIEISRKPLSEELKGASYCLMDTPSSSLWEAMNMGVPAQTLVWSKSELRETAIEEFRDFITFFDSPDDVKEKVTEIWNSKRFATVQAGEFGFNKMSSEDLLEVFRQHCRR